MSSTRTKARPAPLSSCPDLHRGNTRVGGGWPPPSARGQSWREGKCRIPRFGRLVSHRAMLSWLKTLIRRDSGQAQCTVAQPGIYLRQRILQTTCLAFRALRGPSRFSGYGFCDVLDTGRLPGSITRWNTTNPTRHAAQHTCWATSFSIPVAMLSVLILVLAKYSQLGPGHQRTYDNLWMLLKNPGQDRQSWSRPSAKHSWSEGDSQSRG
jgi:hypothetical protein